MKKFKFVGVMDRINASLTPEESNQAFERWIKSILYTRRGLQYLIMKYPNLSIEAAIKEFKIEAAIAEKTI